MTFSLYAGRMPKRIQKDDALYHVFLKGEKEKKKKKIFYIIEYFHTQVEPAMQFMPDQNFSEMLHGYHYLQNFALK